jgi:hypothetical protein
LSHLKAPTEKMYNKKFRNARSLTLNPKEFLNQKSLKKDKKYFNSLPLNILEKINKYLKRNYNYSVTSPRNILEISLKNHKNRFRLTLGIFSLEFR